MTSPRRLFLALLLPLLLMRLWLATVVPITSDEAYFVWWGKHPDFGFYDHPPMVGWWLAAQMLLGDGLCWLRLTAVLQSTVLAAAVVWAMPRIWPGVADDRRWWAGLLCLLAPTAFWNVLITTDTPLIYFCVLSGLAWLIAQREQSYRWYLLAGVLLAGAALSKYFVLFLGFAYLLDVLRQPSRRALAGLLLCFACCLPAIALMLWWNSQNCWVNILFNFLNRHSDTGFGWKNLAAYLLMLVYLLTPASLWYLVRNRRAVSGNEHNLTGVALLAWLPLALFAVLSLVKTVGLHWVLSFLPFVFIWLALRLPQDVLPRLGKFFLGFAVLHGVIFAGLALTHLDAWQHSKFYDSLVIGFEREALAEQLRPYAKDYTLAATGYSDASVLGYNQRHRYIVFGPGSSYARQDDMLTDFRQLAGKNILVFRKTAPDLADYQPYFTAVTVETFELRGVTFYKVLGQHFNYPAYRDSVLAGVQLRFYHFPDWLPHPAGSCYLCDRYFPGNY